MSDVLAASPRLSNFQRNLYRQTSWLIYLLLMTTATAWSFTANLSATPNPNTGDYTVAWSNSRGRGYTLQEQPSGGAWSDIVYSVGSSWDISGQQAGTYLYRLKRQSLRCSGWPEPVCQSTITYSETVSVTVEEGAAPPPPPPPPPTTGVDPGASIESDQIGTTVGDFRVDESGSATYEIPILVAAGTAGVAPRISLKYSSSAENGIAGVGWSIVGLSSISRCRQTYPLVCGSIHLTRSSVI